MLRRSIIYFIILTLLFSSHLPSREQNNYSYSTDAALTAPVSGLQLSHSDFSGVELVLNVPTYSLENESQDSGGTQKISLRGAGQTSDVGKPNLPAFYALIGVPADARVELRVVSDVSESFAGPYNLTPVPRADFVSEDATSAKLVYDRDSKTYHTNALYPTDMARIVEDAWLRDQRVVRIGLYPFQYNPYKGTLLWHKFLKVEVKFIGGASVTNFRTDRGIANDAYDSLLQGLVLNYDVARNWRGISRSEIYHPISSVQSDGAGEDDPAFLGARYKIVVDHDGLYRLTYNDLEDTYHLTSYDPNTFHLYNQGRDVAIYVDDGGDGIFNSGDSIYFFGEQFRGDYLAQRYATESSNWITLTEQLTDGSLVPWHPEFNHFMLEKYTDKNVYYLTVGGEGGPQMSAVNGDPSGSTAPIPATYQATVHAEKELRHWEQSFTSEDTWFWDFVTDYSTHTYTTTLSGLASGMFTATIRGEMAAYSYNANYSPDHHTQFFINTRATPIDDAYWDGKSRYSFESQVPQSDLVEGENQLKFLNVNDAYASPYIGFDFFEIDFTRLFTAEQDKLIFPGETAGTWRYHTGGFSTNSITVYDITDPITPIRVTNPSIINSGGSYSATFLTTHAAGEKYIVVGGYETPNSLTYYQPPDFSSMTEGADYVIISHSDFITTAQTLLDFRASQGLSTMMINVDDLYAEFFYGIFHPLAIKNFLAYTFAHWVKPPTYVILIGDGSWNMKNNNPARYGSDVTYMPPNLSWVDPWLGQTDSSNLLAAVVGDDILPDVLIGRLPVSTSTELSAIISKITSYEQSTPQTWQRNILFIADDTPDPAGDFVAQSDAIINGYVHSGFTPLRIYLDAYKDNNLCGTQPFPLGPTCTPVNHAITETISTTGTLFVNYSGHGALQSWTSDKILLYQVDNPGIPNDYTWDDIGSMENGNMLPIVLSMTCWDGHWFYPGALVSQTSLSEFWLRTPGRGAVAVYAAAGLGVEAGHEILQEGFYNAVFNEGIWNLGSAILAGKLNLYQSGGNYDLINTYVTFGDPALHILSPYRVSLSPDAREGMALPGNSVTYTFQVTNQSTITDTFAPSVIDNIWPASFPATIGPLSAGQSQAFDVTVMIPAGADGGVTDTSNLVITSLGDRSRTDTATLITHSQAVYDVQISPENSSQFNLPGSAVVYNLQVTNTGNHADSYNVSIDSNKWDVNAPATIGPISRGQTATLPVTVYIPSDAKDRDYDSVSIQVTSQADPTKAASSLLTTTARTYGVAFNPSYSSIEALQGTTVTYTLQVENTGGYTDTFSVTADSQWTTEVTPTMVGPIAPAQSADVRVTVEIPTGLPGGSYDEAIVTATSGGDPDRTGQALLRTIGDTYGLLVRPAFAEQVDLPGSTVTYTLQLTNTSSFSDSFHIVMGHHSWSATLSANTIGPLNGNGGSATFDVSVDIPQGAADWATDSVVITVTSQTNPSRIAIATLVSTARLYGVSMEPADMENEGVPGEVVIYPLTVSDTGGYMDTFTVTANGGWPVEVYPSVVGPLEPAASKRITVTVQIPSDVGNATDPSLVVVTSWSDPNIFDRSTLMTTSKLYGAALDQDRISGLGLPGEDVVFNFQVTNTSNYTDTFTVHVTSPWRTEADPVWIGPLAPHATASLRVTVHIPIDAVYGSSSVATMRVTSRADDTRQAVAYIATYVGWIPVYLPITQK